jgi:hypothetical protein
MTKAKEAIEAKEPQLIEYDSRISQRVPLQLEQNGNNIRVAHILKPLTNERYLEYQDQVADLATRIKKISTEIMSPQYQLWCDLVEGREGYKERDDWKEKTHKNDAVAAVSALLSTQVLDNSEVEGAKAELYDEDALTVIHFRALQSGVLIGLSHSFREETKAEADEFLAIDAGQDDANNLASAEKITKQERLYRLGKKLLKEHTGYADGSDIPVWHLAATTESFFLRQVARMGKFLRP